MDTKVIGGARAQIRENLCVLLQLECLTHYKESNISLQDKAHRSSVSLCREVVEDGNVDLQKIQVLCSALGEQF